MSISEVARKLAHERHVDQFRPNKKCEPKRYHLAEVVDLAKAAGCSENEIAAAWLHDIIEDTDTSLQEIVDLFGTEIAELVNDLTDPPDFAELPLAIRKSRQGDRLKEKSRGVKLIKLCDQISNVRSVVDDPPCDWDFDMSLTYIEGAKKLADISHGLSSELDRLFDEAYQHGIKKYKKNYEMLDEYKLN